MVNSVQNTGIYPQYAYNPYMYAKVPQSYLVVPQGQVVIPNTVAQLPQTQPMAQVQQSENLNYNQVAPYINTNSKVFNPQIQTQSGMAISTANAVSSPYLSDDAQLVYKGPVKTVNPQITPDEQIDNQVEKEFLDYFRQKSNENEELKSAINKTFNKKKKTSPLASFAKIIALLIIIGGAYKYRKHIPLIKKLFK